MRTHHLSAGAAQPIAAIFDVDGVLVESPHERAWREGLAELMAADWRAIVATTGYTPERLTPAVYQAHVAGKPRLSGARAVLDYFGVPDAERRARDYADRKQRRIEQLIEAGEFVAFPDAVQLVLELKARGMPLAVASSSKNANHFMERIRVDRPGQALAGQTLLDLFDANVCGRDVPFGKPDPHIFLLAAAELGVAPAGCVVVEDAPSGIQAARAAGMASIGVARLHDEALLVAAGADLVVASLGEGLVLLLLERRLQPVGQGGRA